MNSSLNSFMFNKILLQWGLNYGEFRESTPDNSANSGKFRRC